ncbi:hypothetical protein Mal65_15280 [Crateriforma conspicua]|nr:hypothetical protein Mal65_15280 [Crateriforma conspicua]
MPHGTHANGLTQVGRTGRRTIDARAREDSKWIHQRVSVGDISASFARTTDGIGAAAYRSASPGDQDVGRFRRSDREAHGRSNHHAALGQRLGPVTARRNQPHNGQRRCRRTKKRCRPEPPTPGRSDRCRGRGVTAPASDRAKNVHQEPIPHAKPTPHDHPKGRRRGSGGNNHRTMPPVSTRSPDRDHRNSRRATMQASAPSPRRRGVRDRQPVGTKKSRFA